MEARKAMAAGAILAAVSSLGIGVAIARKPAPAPPAVQEQLIGTWKLVARDVVRPDGTSNPDPAYGPKYPLGYIMYDQTGHMAVQFMGLDRPDDQSSKAYDAYFGTYTINEKTRPMTVTHHMEGSLNPRNVGRDAVRDLLLDGDSLKLIVHNGNNANVNVNTFIRVK